MSDSRKTGITTRGILNRRVKYDVELTRNVLIQLADGTQLAADIYLPRGAGPSPTLVSPTPYRKDDYVGAAWQAAISYFVERGYAHVVADFRGLGSSGGVAAEAMSGEEAADGAAAVAWAAAQSWSDGNIGMYGVSYGGISALRTASVRPPNLRAIIPIFASFDIYRDWIYPGGCFNCLGVSTWCSFMLAMQLAPPMYQDHEGRWYDVWRARLEKGEPALLPWLDHPMRDDFWREKAIPVEQIEVPTFLIGGWRDLYPEAMTRAYAQISAPRKLWMGPWSHRVPDSSPVTAVEYLPEMLRWFDRFVCDEPNGIETEPPVTLYTQGDRAGWTHEREWPIARASQQAFFLAADRKLIDKPATTERLIRYVADPTVGVQAGLWDVRGSKLGLPLDQRPDDDHSLSFTTAPLVESLTITGSPEAVLTIAVDQGDDTNLVVKICDVARGGFSTLVTTGWLKTTRRFLDDRNDPMPKREFVEIRIPLWATSYRVAAGHRLRVSVSCSDFPRIWPSRSNSHIRLAVGGGQRSFVELPVVSLGGAEGPAPKPVDPTQARPGLIHESTPIWRHERDLATNAVSVVFGEGRVITTPGCDGRMALDLVTRATVAVDAPNGAMAQSRTRLDLDMPAGGRTVVVAESRVTLDGFVLRGCVDVDGVPFFEKHWRR